MIQKGVTQAPANTKRWVGISIDILTPVFPVSFTYAIPLEKKSSDTTKEFNFSLGTSF